MSDCVRAYSCDPDRNRDSECSSGEGGREYVRRSDSARRERDRDTRSERQCRCAGGVCASMRTIGAAWADLQQRSKITNKANVGFEETKRKNEAHNENYGNQEPNRTLSLHSKTANTTKQLTAFPN